MPANSQPTSNSHAIPTPPELAHQYTFVKKIGQGTQANVYLAIRNADNTKVAVKHLNIDSVKTWKEYDLFHREADVLKNLHIDGVARFYDAPEFLSIEHPAAYIIQEYIEGQSLDTLMKDGYRFTLQKLFGFVIHLLDILNQLHTHNPPIIHRDLKPGNIMMVQLPNGDFKPYLIDFGAVANPQVQSGGSTVAGTYGFMPPEQLMGNPVPASDIYSLAAMIVYLISGVSPGNMQITDFHLIIEPHLENIPNIITATLHQMLEPVIEKRLADYKSLRERFELFAAGKFEMSFNSSATLDEEKLLKVQKIGQRGNIDLWMALANQTPRTIPKYYHDLTPSYNTDTKSVYPILKNYYIKQIIKTILKCTPVNIFLYPAVFFLLRPNTLTFIAAGFFIILAIGIYILSCSAYFKMIKKLSAHSDEWEPLPLNTNNYDLENILSLLKNGSKSIAIMIDCAYQPAFSDTIQLYEQFLPKSNLSDPDASNLINSSYHHTYPKFRLRYKFNPPDDDNPDELVHEIYIHRDINDILQAGDPIPILYYVNQVNHLDVMSMPFPYPLGDIASLDEMYYKSVKTESPS